MAVALALLGPGVCALADPQRVLIVHSFGRDFAPFNSIATAFRTELVQQLGRPVAFHDVSLDVERGPLEDERAFIDFLRDRYGSKPPDLVVTIGAPAARFHKALRPQLFAQAPALITGIDQRFIEGLGLQPRDRAVTIDINYRAIVEGMRALLPATNLVAIVQGASAHEQSRLKLAEADFAAAGVSTLALGGLALDELRHRVATLPPGSVVFYGMYAIGPDGVLQENDRALAAVRDASAAPVFGLYESQLGGGIVGGRLFDLREMGRASARVARRMLAHDDAGAPDATSLALPLGTPAYDARELDRWHIPESRLPAGADVRFREPSLWQRHRTLAMAIAAVFVVQATLIVALLLQRARRRLAEREALGLGGRLLTAHEDERRRLARELHDDLTQRLARLAIDASRLERTAGPGSDAAAMREDLVRLSEDVHALSYRLHPSVLDDLGLVEALRAECDRIARAGDVRVSVEATDVPVRVPDDAQLCLFRVAQEALNNASRHARASSIKVLLQPSGRGLQLAVSDDGTGFDAHRAPAKASLGMASMRERVRAVQGRLGIESTPGRGTTVTAWVPA